MTWSRDLETGSLFSYVDLEARVPGAHPLRRIAVIVNDVSGDLSPAFSAMYSRIDRPSIAPGKLLPALLLRLSIRSGPSAG